MRSFLRGLVALFLLGLLLAGCGGTTSPSTSTSTAPGASPSLPPSPAVGVNTQQLVVQLNPENNSGVAGTATLRPGTNGTSVNLELLGASPVPAGSPATSPLVGISYPAGIYQGTCAQHGATAAYPLQAATYNAPTPGSTSTVNVPLTTLTGQNYAIVVQKSPSDTTPISCGEIRTSGLPVSPVPSPS